MSVDTHLFDTEYAAWRNAPDWELRNIVVALSSLPWLNGPREEARLAAVRTIRRERKN